MLIINGALAVFNGLLFATGKFWCECVRGGTCCGGECRCDEGVCCDEVWHTDEDPDEPCPEGEVFFQWCVREEGEEDGDYEHCGCLPETIFDPREQDDVNTADVVAEFCCCGPVPVLPFDQDGNPIGCLQRCCTNGNCTNSLPGDCLGEVLSGCCQDLGCRKSCCTEDTRGRVLCDTVDEFLCTGVVDTEPCETSCKGTCCVSSTVNSDTGEPTGEPVTQAECEALGGCWQGVGTLACETLLDGGCRAPFDEDCCESVVSSAELLTFTGPGKRRCPELTCDVRVTVQVTTGSPVYIHGGLFGAPYEACTDEVTFTVCNDQFHVTPAPCSGNLQGLDIKTCWGDANATVTGELLRFRCCQDITHLIGNCDCDCVTTVLYEDEGCTSNAFFVMRGDATIDSSGTGPLVLTGNITHENDCERTLTLRGSNAGNNWLSGAITDGSGTSVGKADSGSWRLSAPSTYSGKLRVLSGTLVVDANVGTAGASPFGTATATSGLPEIGEDGSATLFVEGGRTISRGFSVVGGSGVVTIGMVGSGTATFDGSFSVRLARGVTLQAVSGGTVRFANAWQDIGGGGSPAVAFTIGSPDNAGTVELASFLPDAITAVDVRHGTLRLDYDDPPVGTIGFATPVTLGPAVVTLDLAGYTQSLASLTFEGSGSTVAGPGTLRTYNNGSTAEIDVSGTGHTISADVELADPTEIQGALTISGIVSGSGSLTKGGSGTLTLEGDITYTGQTSIAGGTLVAEKEFAGSADISLVTFTPTTLVVAFTMNPTSGATYKLLGGSTLQTYGAGAVTLTEAGGATGTYDSSTSTLTID